MIDTINKLGATLEELKLVDWVAVDTEADSLHAYPEKLCLIQVSIQGRDLLIDPLSGIDLRSFWDLLAHHELIMHGADYDLRLLSKNHGFVPGRIFDTMLAARLLGATEFGLTHLVERHLGIQLQKGSQKADWGRRPLTGKMEDYARNDTRYLKPLEDILRQQLAATGRLAWHQQCCQELVRECSIPSAADPEAWRIRGSHILGPAALGVLRELWGWREKEAIAGNRPPYFILKHEILVALAVAAVSGEDVTERLPRKFSPPKLEGLRAAIDRGLKLSAEELPSLPSRNHRRASPKEKQRFHQLQQIRDRKADELKIDPTLIASRGMLLDLSEDPDSGKTRLMLWQCELLEIKK